MKIKLTPNGLDKLRHIVDDEHDYEETKSWIEDMERCDNTTSVEIITSKSKNGKSGLSSEVSFSIGVDWCSAEALKKWDEIYKRTNGTMIEDNYMYIIPNGRLYRVRIEKYD